MTNDDTPWAALHEMWHGAADRGPKRPSMGRAFSSHRSGALDVVQALIGIGALSLLGAAVHHAADFSETILAWSAGSVIVVAAVVTWSARHRETAALTQTTSDYLVALHRSAAHRILLARFIWVVLGAETVFLVRWWAGGIRVHERDLGSSLAWLTLWLPIAMIVALLFWSVRLGRRAVKEARAIEQARSGFQA